MNAILTDLYQLTMAAGYWQSGKAGEVATFELFVRRLPPNRNFLVAAGLAQAVEYLLNLRFAAGEIDYLRGLPQFRNAGGDYFEMLAGFRFTGDLFAVQEGTPIFAGEPILTVRAPLLEAQIPETYLLAMVGFQTLIASKAARLVESAAGRAVVEFGTRRAHGPEAGVLAGRAAFVGGCAGTSNTLAGMRYGIPVFGTAAHSWVQSFPTEAEAFARLQNLMGPATTYLIDTYDTLEGARQACAVGKPFWGVRLDSGDLAVLARQVRAILDDAGCGDARIMATGDLNERKIAELLAAGVPVDAFGVGTELATSADAPSHGAVYKLVEIGEGEGKRPTSKASGDKATLPGPKQIFRYADHDVLGLASESHMGCEALLRPVVLHGEPIGPQPSIVEIREYARRSVAALPDEVRGLDAVAEPRRIQHSARLIELREAVLRSRA